MKRLNNYLLTHYPLLWNMRVHYIWPVILVLHLLFFLFGYTSVRFPGTSAYPRMHPSEETVVFAILLGLLAMVWWLVLYFRNNAFKRFLPLRPGHLAAEMALIFVTAYGLSSLSTSSAYGKAAHVRALSAGTDVMKERETLALALHFLPYNLENFSRFNLPSEQSPVTLNDSDALPVDTFSYLNFGGENYYYGQERAAIQTGDIHKRATGWLNNGHQDSVLRVLKDYLVLVKKYGGNYRFNPEAHVQSIFSRPDFGVRYTVVANDLSLGYDQDVYHGTETVSISEPPGYADGRAPALQYANGYAYISRSNPEWGLSQVEAARFEMMDFEVNVFLLYAALVITILIFGFRLTEGRTWGIAVIGAGLVVVFSGLLIAGMGGERSALGLVLFLEILFTGLALAGIASGWKRRWAGVMFLWSLAAMPLLLPALWYLMRELSERDYDAATGQYAHSPLHDWLRDHQNWCTAGNIVVSLALIVVFYIPLARKWQAMAEE